MTGQKKTMEGGMLGLITKNYNNVPINDLATKIISGKYGEKSSLLNKLFNDFRAEQRIIPFFKKLINEIELTKQIMTDERLNQLLQYFKNIIEKYPDEINNFLKEAVISAKTNQSGQRVYHDDFSKAKNFFIKKGKFEELQKIFENLKKKNKSGSAQQTTNYTRLRPNTINGTPKVPQTLRYMPLQENMSATVPQHNTSTIVPGALSNQNKIDKSYEELIKQLDEIIEILKNPNLKQKINNENKTRILSHISNLAEQIKKLVNIYKLPTFKDDKKANFLIFKLSELISIYKLILSNNSNNKQRANYLNSIYRNLTPSNLHNA